MLALLNIVFSQSLNMLCPTGMVEYHILRPRQHRPFFWKIVITFVRLSAESYENESPKSLGR